MKTVQEYREFAEDCRMLAKGISNPDDKRAVEMMATAWDKVADQREAALKRGLPVVPPTDEVPTALASLGLVVIS
jgi:hypothetical protein